MLKKQIVLKCQICKKIYSNNTYSPFCNERCKNVDLYKWLNNGYVISSLQDEMDDEQVD